MNIGNRILNIRKENQLTQEEFGKLFHVTRQTVSNWENGNNEVEYLRSGKNFTIRILTVCNSRRLEVRRD